MNPPKVEAEHINGAKNGDRPKYATNQKSNVNTGYFIPSDQLISATKRANEAVEKLTNDEMKLL